jgi:putative salt-induced outer membrane protein YdiY
VEGLVKNVLRIVLPVALLIVFTLGAGVAARADTVVLKNGDHLTGTVTNVRGANVLLKSDVGDVTIPVGKIQTLTIDKPAVIIGKDKKVSRGQVALVASGSWQVTANGTSQTVAPADVVLLLPQDAYDTLVDVPSAPWRLWKGTATLGYSFQHGDQQTTTLTGVVAATRERSVDLLFVPHMRTNYTLNLLFSKANQDGTSVTSNTFSTNLREDYLFTPQNFVFAFGQLDHIDTQGLYLRQSAGGGLGRDFIHTGRTTLSLLGGFNYVHDKFLDGLSDQSVQALVGDKFGIQINKRVRFDQQLTFYPDLRVSGQYRFDGSASFTFKVSNHLTANVALIDLFLKQPSPGNHENNETLTTGIGYIF